jgi:RimJ/RimL family protein N-acetyltransferase
MKAMEPLAYLHLQLRLEGMETINGCFVRQGEIVPGEEVPLMLIALLANGGLVTYYDEVIPPELERQLSTADIDFPIVSPLLDALKTRNKQVEMGHYKTYVFPPQPAMDIDVLCLSKHDSRVKAFGFDDFAEQVYAIEKNGVLVSACVSTRENRMCGEAWVYTTPEYRKRGLAQKVVNTWAGGLMAAGKVPFYSHDIKNEASANLARKLGLLPVFEEITITQNQT